MRRVPLRRYEYVSREIYLQFSDDIWDEMARELKVLAENNCLMIPPHPEEMFVLRYFDKRRQECDFKDADVIQLKYMVKATAA